MTGSFSITNYNYCYSICVLLSEYFDKFIHEYTQNTTRQHKI